MKPASAPTLYPEEVVPLPVSALLPLLVRVIVDVIVPLTVISTLCSPTPLNCGQTTLAFNSVVEVTVLQLTTDVAADAIALRESSETKTKSGLTGLVTSVAEV